MMQWQITSILGACILLYPQYGSAQLHQERGTKQMTEIIPMTEERLPQSGYVFKHSTQCPISAAAAREVRAHRWELPLYWVNVIEQRPLSKFVEQASGVKHESPQLLKFEDGKVVRTLNHREIRAGNF